MITELREEFAKLHNECNTVIESAAKAGKPLSAEDKASQDKRYARMDEIKSIVDENNRLAKYAFNADNVVKMTVPLGKSEFEAEAKGEIKFEAGKYKDAVNVFARTGDMSALQRFAITTGTQSGAFLPKEVFQPTLVRRNNNAIRALMDAYNVPSIKRSVAESLSLPISDDTSNVGQQQSEGATSGTTADPSFSSSVVLNPTLYSSKQMWFSNTQVSAVDFDIFSYALPVMQKRVDKSQESAWTTTLLTGTTGKTTASGTAITYAELLAWEHSLPVAYRSDAGFIVSDSLYQLIRGLVDSNNRPIMDLDPTNVFQARIHGKPVFVSDYMQTVATGHKSGAFCSAEALKVLDVLNARIARYQLVPSNPDQTGFELFVNGDMNFDPNGVRLVAHT